MKKFFEMLVEMDAENCAAVLNNLQVGKIPATYVSFATFADAVEAVKNFRAQGLNITALISNQVPKEILPLDFAVFGLRDIAKIQPRPEYIFADDKISSAYATKIFSKSKVITLQNKNLRELGDKHKIFVGNLMQFEEMYQSLADEESRRTFRGYFLGNVLNQIGAANFTNIPHYLTAGFTPKPENVVVNFEIDKVDGWKKFTKLNCKVYDFEVGNQTLPTAENLVAENRGLDGYVHDNFTMLDEYVREKKLPRVDFFNVNVSGNERNILRGAAEIILRFKPTIAITVQDKWLELAELVKILKSFRTDYKFEMRQCVATPKDEPEKFQGDTEKILLALNLGLELRNLEKVTLLAH